MMGYLRMSFRNDQFLSLYILVGFNFKCIAINLGKAFKHYLCAFNIFLYGTTNDLDTIGFES